MFRHLFIASLLSAGVANAECPQPKDLSAQIDPLMRDLAQAANERVAQGLSDKLWRLWLTAPDSRAQEYLSTGLQRRSEYNLLAAWEAFDLLVAYCPDYAEGYNQRAYIAFLQKDYASALDDLEKALVRDPDHIAALAGKALTEMGLGGQEAGQETLKAALKLNPWLTERRFLIEPLGQDI